MLETPASSALGALTAFLGGIQEVDQAWLVGGVNTPAEGPEYKTTTLAVVLDPPLVDEPLEEHNRAVSELVGKIAPASAVHDLNIRSFAFVSSNIVESRIAHHGLQVYSRETTA